MPDTPHHAFMETPAGHVVVREPTEERAGLRLFSLDVLRGAAIALVLVRHMPIPPPSDPVGGVEAGLRVLQEVGWTGVDLFFVLSGFLISGLLFKEYNRTGTIRLGRFWLRRGFKIWPAYFAVYGGLLIWLVARSAMLGKTSQAHSLLSDAALNVLFVQNYFEVGRQWPNSWSLAIEEHFYLALPLVLLVLARGRGREPFRWLLAVTVGGCCLILGMRLFASASGAGWMPLQLQSHMRADSLLWGVLLGYLYRYRPDRLRALARPRWLWMGAACAAVLVMALFPLYESPLPVTVGFTLLYLAFGGLVAVAATAPDLWRKSLVGRFLAFLGVYSYTIYLAHSVMSRLPGWQRLEWVIPALWGRRALYFYGAVALGVLVSHAVERPFLRLRGRLFPSATEESAAHNPPF
jgi:peptidoglycan/LPS O-acetylase OafA/YrhL